MHKTISIIVSGRVQGVFYRQSTKEKASSLQVTGIVKNLPDGRVQIIATGTSEVLDSLVAWCKTGPPKANVTDVQVSELPLQTFPAFRIERF